MPLLLRLPVVTSLLLAACGGGGEAAGAQPRVVASLYPLAFVVEEVAGDLVDLDNLTPPGAEPHDLELTAGQIRSLVDADLVVYIGRGFQPALEDALADLDSPRLDVLEIRQDLLTPRSDARADPHVWLDPERLAHVAQAVADGLMRLDQENARRYQANVARLQSRLDALDFEFRDGLARCERSTIVTSHEAFGYLADAYGLEEIGVAGIDPEAEPSPGRLAEVAEFVEENAVTTIFFEVLVPPQTAETLAEEAGIVTARLDPLEGAPEDGDYFSAMRANLDALRRGLDCA